MSEASSRVLRQEMHQLQPVRPHLPGLPEPQELEGPRRRRRRRPLDAVGHGKLNAFFLVDEAPEVMAAIEAAEQICLDEGRTTTTHRSLIANSTTTTTTRRLPLNPTVLRHLGHTRGVPEDAAASAASYNVASLSSPECGYGYNAASL